LIYSTTLSLALGIVPVGVFFFTLGFKPLLGFAALLAVLLGSITTSFFLVFIYAGVMRVIHPNKLRRAMGYVQMAMSFIFSGGYLLLMGAMQTKSMGSMTLTPEPWFFLLPPLWFASYLKLAIGDGRLLDIGAALFSLAALVFLFIKARGKLALDYADQLSSAMAVSEGPKKISKSTARRSRLFREGESRVVALLVRNQFKYDQKFRLAVLGILPLSAVYLFMGLQRGPLADPFVIHGFGPGNSWLLYFAVLMFPIMLNASLANSDSYQASWIYYATPADRSRLILASKGFVFAYFVIPYLTFLGALFLYFWGNLLHVVVHLGVLALLSYIFLQIAVLLHPVLPFSMPSRKAERSTKFVGIMMLTPIIAIGLMGVLFYLAYPHPPLLAGALFGLGLLSWLLEIALQKRAQRRTASMEYQG
jgi:hypothetical protein